MKKTWKLVLCMALAVTMLSCAALAAGEPEVAVNTAAYSSLASNAVAVAADGTVTVTIPAAMVKDGEQYVVILVKPKTQADTAQALLSADYELGESTILYIDQYAATASGLTFTGKPRSMASCVVLLGGKDAGGAAIPARVIGAIKTSGVSVSGTVTAKGAADTDTTAKVELLDGTTSVADANVALASGVGAYTLDGVPDGAYTLKVTCGTKYVAREYALNTATTLAQNAEIWPKGDVDGNGNLNMTDYTNMLRHVKKTKFLTDYALKCADTDSNGNVNMTDYTNALRHVKKTRPLW